MSVRRVLVVFVVAAAAAGCSSDHKATPEPTTTTTAVLTVQQRATVECKQALRHAETFATAQATTVGAMHLVTGGPVPTGHPWAYLYKGKSDNAFAAWCWRMTGNRSYQSYVVGPGDPIFLDVRTNGVDAAPVGPMSIV